MFDRLEPFLRGQLDVGDLHVVLVIEPRLHAQLLLCALRHHPDRNKRRFLGCIRAGRFVVGAVRPEPVCGNFTRLRSILQDIRDVHFAIGASGRDDEGLAVMPGRRALGIGAERGLFGIPAKLAAAMRPQVHDRRPATRHSNGIAEDFFQHFAFARLYAATDGVDALGPLDLDRGRAGFDANAQCLRFLHQRAAALGAGIEDRRHLETCLHQPNSGAVRVIIIGHNDRAVAGADTEVHEVVPHGRSQHHPGNVVARKAERPFNGPRRGDDLRCSDTPQPMAGSAGLRCVIGQPFVAQHIAVVIDARPHGAGADLRVGQRVQFGARLRDPGVRVHAVDGAAIDRGTPAKMSRLFDQQNLGTGARCRQRRLQTGHAAADDQNIGEGIEMLVPVGVAGILVGRLAQAG